ncbi:hypothetical protein ACFLU5_13335 [Bacteroidota bacterium]
MIIKPEYNWENLRIGGSLPPIRTSEGWLVIYHGVEMANEKENTVIYRAWVMLLDLADPAKVLKRSKRFIMEPEMYYEKSGLYIPNVIFPTGGYVDNNMLYLYYGACDTAIALAAVDMDDLMEFIDKNA